MSDGSVLYVRFLGVVLFLEILFSINAEDSRFSTGQPRQSGGSYETTVSIQTKPFAHTRNPMKPDERKRTVFFSLALFEISMLSSEFHQYPYRNETF